MNSVDNNMNVKTTRPDVNQSSPQTGRVSDTATKSPSTADSSSVSSDTVTLTNAAADMRKLEETLANLPDVDNSRVAEIKASIADGSYQVEPEKIVSSLLALERDLL